jgi:hypothetical protein
MTYSKKWRKKKWERDVTAKAVWACGSTLGSLGEICVMYEFMYLINYIFYSFLTEVRIALIYSYFPHE